MANDFKVRFYSGIGARGPQGPQGEKGDKGATGDRGPVGYHFTPSVSTSGDLSWTNDGGLTNPKTVNLTDKFVSTVEAARSSVTALNSDVQALDASISDATAAVEQAMEAIDGIEAQRDEIMESIAAAAELGTDTSLSTAGMAADAKAAGTEIRTISSGLFADINDTDMWAVGAISSSNGANSSSTTRLRTSDYLPKGVSKISVPGGYRFILFGYDGSTYKGTWNGTSFSKSANWQTGDINLSLLLDYNYKLVLAKAVDSGTMTTSEAANVSLYSVTDDTLTMSGKAADAGRVGRYIARALVYRGLLTSDDSLNNIWTPGMWRVGASNRPAGCPTLQAGVFLVIGEATTTVAHFQFFISISNHIFFRYGTSSDNQREWYEIDSDALPFIRAAKKVFTGLSIAKGSWTRTGVHLGNDVKSVCNKNIIETKKGTAYNMLVDDGWAYTTWEGNSANALNKTHYLSRDSRLIAAGNYIGIHFVKLDSDGEPVNTAVSEWDDSVVMMKIGDESAASGDSSFSQYVHDLPESVGQLNVVLRAYQMTKIQYMAAATLPLHSGGSVSVTVRDVPAGTELVGVPYSSMRDEMSYIPQAISFDTFMSAIQNPNSYIYTRHYEQTDKWYNARCYYGAVCSSMVGYVYGIENAILTTISFANYPGFEPLPEEQQSVEYLKLGDMLNKAGTHIVVITDIVRSNRGRIVSIEISEASKPLCRSAVYTPEQFETSYLDNGFVAYRYADIADVPYDPSPWVHVDSTENGEPVYDTALSPRRGDKANWRLGETVEIDVLDAGSFTAYALKNVTTGVTVAQGSIPESNLITFANLSDGHYSVNLTDGSNDSASVYFDVIETTVTYEALSNGKVKVNYSSSIGTPSAVYWCHRNPNASDYKGVRAFHILTSEEIAAGTVTLTHPTDVTGVYEDKWLMRMSFKCPFGLFASDLTDVNVLP